MLHELDVNVPYDSTQQAEYDRIVPAYFVLSVDAVPLD